MFEKLGIAATAVAEELRTAFPVKAAASVLRKSGQTIYNETAKGQLRALRVGGKIFIPLVEIERVLLAASH